MQMRLIKAMLVSAKDDDYLQFDFESGKELLFKKSLMECYFLQKGKYIQIEDKSKKELHMINTSKIDLITLIKPKFKTIS